MGAPEKDGNRGGSSFRKLQYPDLSLTALCGCFDPAVSKSGLSHRMKKLEALADALRQRVEKGQEAEP